CMLYEGECSATAGTQCWMALFHRQFNVLRVIVRAADNHHILDPAGDVEFPCLVKAPKIAGSQPGSLTFINDFRMKGIVCCLRILPVSLSYIRPVDPES